MDLDQSFLPAYRELEDRMRARAAADGDIYLPNPEPEGPVHHILICMEPSLGRWARSPEEASSRVKAGFRNFVSSVEDFILHFSVRRYLCGPGQRYHITDLSKGAMLVDRAGLARVERYDRWYALLNEEIDLVAKPGARIVAVGSAVAEHLERQQFRRPFTRVIHYSGQAGPARNRGIAGREDDFEAFRKSVTLEDLVATASDVLRVARLPDEFREETLARLARSQLTVSRQKLIFAYRVAFEATRF
jgi:hypothetical protein